MIAVTRTCVFQMWMSVTWIPTSACLGSVRTRRALSSAIVSWAIRWRRGPRDAQVGLNPMSARLQPHRFQKQPSLQPSASLSSCILGPAHQHMTVTWWVTDSYLYHASCLRSPGRKEGTKSALLLMGPAASFSCSAWLLPRWRAHV